MKTSPWLLAERGSLAVGRVIRLNREEARHASGPLRLGAGDSVILVDGAGRLAEAVLREVARGQAGAEVLSVREEPPPSGKGVTLALAILHGRGMDWAVEKAVEVGVRRFVPVVGERTQAGRRAALDRSSHWSRIALQALKQCKRMWAMEVAAPLTLTEVAERYGPSGTGVVAHRHGVAFSNLPTSHGRVLLVGPEGGLTPEEEMLLSRLGWPRLRLGPHVLRSETAAIVGAALLVARDDDS